MCSRRLDSCMRNFELHEELGDRLLKNIITEDETPLSLYVPDSKRASMEWKFPGERATRKLRSGTSHRRILMLTIFWDHKGVIKMDFADRDTKITGEYYAQLVTEESPQAGICICCMTMLRYTRVDGLNPLCKVPDSFNFHIRLTVRTWPQATFSSFRI